MPPLPARLLLLTRLLTAAAATATATASCGGSVDDTATTGAAVSGASAGQGGAGAGGAAPGGSGGVSQAGQAGSGGVSQAGQAGSAGASQAGQAGQAGSAGSPAAPPPLPTATYPQCTGVESMVSGPCCKYLECYTPPEGHACLPAPSGTGYPAKGDPTIPPLCVGVGSGTCTCGPIEGPFAGPVGDPTQFKDAGISSCIGVQQTPPVSPYQDGTCCYLVPIEGCEGRPLFVEGALRKAAVQRGAAW